MPQSMHSVLYRRMRSLLWKLTFGVSLGFRIYFSTFLILFVSCACYAVLYYLQARQFQITSAILNQNINAIEAARHIKEAVVTFDNSIFRFIATKSDDELLQASDQKNVALLELERLRLLSTGRIDQSMIDRLKKRLNGYFVEADHMIVYVKKNELPHSAGIFQAATWAQKKVIQSKEMSAISPQGSGRMERVLVLCDTLITTNQVALESARTKLDELRRDGRRVTQVVFYVAFGLVLVISMALAITLIGPIRTLMRGVRDLEAGRFDIELPVTSSTEVGQLITAFNRMAKTIHQQREQLMNETITDNLTGAYNQRYWTRRLEEEFDRSKRAGEPLSIMIIDVDHFKKFNDTFGHEWGNELLKKLARIIRDNLRHIDLLFRYGGDEFTVILPKATASESQVIAQRLIEAAKEISLMGLQAIEGSSPTISIGGASYPENAASLDDLKTKADKMLYVAKSEGRNCFYWHGLSVIA